MAGWSLGSSLAPTKGATSSLQNPSDELISMLGGSEVSAGVRVTSASALKVSVVFACVRVIMEDIAKLPVQVWKDRKAEDGGGRDILKRHQLHRVLQRPNRLMSRYSFMAAMGANYALRGNAIAVKVRDVAGKVVGLWPVQSSRAILYEANNGMLFYGFTSKWSDLERFYLSDEARPNVMVPDFDVVHVRGATLDGLVGMSPLWQMREPIGNAIAGDSRSGSQFKNGAQLSGVIRHPGKLKAEELKRLQEDWKNKYTGAANSGGTPVLENGMEYAPISMSSQEAQHLELLQHTDAQIASAFRVPLRMIGRADAGAKADAEQDARQYYDQTLMPALEAFESEFARSFDLKDDVYAEYDVSRLNRANFKSRQEGRRLQKQSGVISANEWRIAEGLNPVSCGDVFDRPLNTAFVDERGKVVYITPAGGSDSGSKPTEEEDQDAKPPADTEE